ncbi:MAG TPA: electron transport complex subunit RsxC [Deltaproteobacteria bacterium]|nr:electron transport complex subunit RsxC [Deltaproteobacteria bacterium]
MNLKTFERGVHPSYHKELTAERPVEPAGLPGLAVVPLQQHIGAPCEPLVKRGDRVEEGQKIGDARAFVSAPVHASISGKVKDVALHPYPGGGRVLSVFIEGDGERKDWDAAGEEVDIDAVDAEKLRSIVREAGIVGMGGAAFPSAVKLSPPGGRAMDHVILNGCECEPFLTSDHRLMVEEPRKVLMGLKIIMKTVGAARASIGIEDNKPDAIEALGKEARGLVPGLEIVPLETKYPQGAEKMLIKAVLGRTVPLGKLPLDVGVVVNNVGTAVAIYEAVRYGKPLIERVVTVSGNGVKEPRNLLVRIGTSFDEVIGRCGGLAGEGEIEILNGGPMMGIAQTSLDVPVIKGTSGITLLRAGTIKPAEYGPCIRCASCVEACPMGLMPYRIGDLGRLYMVDAFEGWSGEGCIECGCCSFVCPSKRPLVQWIRLGKLKLRESRREAAAR